jgi:hypothetical protein
MKKFLIILMIFTIVFAFNSVIINVSRISKFVVAAKPKTYSLVHGAGPISKMIVTSKPETLSATNISSISKPTKAFKAETPNITIDAIGMHKQRLQYATIKKINDLYSKMQQSPVVENSYTPDLCTE